MNPTILRRGRGGFTFLEIMLVVVIIGILASIVGPKLVGQTGKAKAAAAKAQIASFKTALSTYEMAMGDFPKTEQGLRALVTIPSGVSKEDWGDGFWDDVEIPLDPWHKPYNYVYPGTKGLHYDLWSDGPTDSKDDDIANWSTAQSQ